MGMALCDFIDKYTHQGAEEEFGLFTSLHI